MLFSEAPPPPFDAACLQGHVNDNSLLGRDSVHPGSARDDSCE